MDYCNICYSSEECFVCERCDLLFCEECSTVFTLHNQIDFNCCISCSNNIHKFTSESTIRSNKIDLLIK